MCHFTCVPRVQWNLSIKDTLGSDYSPYYRGILNSEVTQYTTVLHWDTEWCPCYRGFCNSEVCNREAPLYFHSLSGANCMPPLPRSKVNVDCVTVSTLPVKSAIEGHIQHLFDALLSSLRRSIHSNITAIDDFLKAGNEALSVRPQTIEEIGEVNVKHSELSQSKPKVWATMQSNMNE